MCTVTVIPAGNKIFITSNRDEKQKRKQELALVFFKKKRQFILPKPEYASFLFFFIPVNFLVKSCSQTIQVFTVLLSL